MARSALVWLAAIVAGLIALRIFVMFLEPRMAFFPTHGLDVTPRQLGIPFEEIEVRTADGETLQAWWLPNPRPLAEVVYWHGNGGNLSVWLEILAGIRGHGFSVLALDYRGYGQSTGTPSERGLYRDADALIRRFRAGLHRPDAVVVYWGRSLGTAVAAYATTVDEPDGLILEAGFPDARSVLRRDPLLTFLALFSSYRFPTGQFLRDFDRPTLVIHAELDDVVPPELGRELFAGLKATKEYVAVAGAGHNDVLGAEQEEYWKAIRGFVERIRTDREVVRER